MRALRLAGLAGALVVLSATAASGHPSFNPNVVPVGEPVEAVLVVPHGCSTGDGVRPEEGEAVPTTRFDLQTVDGVHVEPAEVDGWVTEDDGEAIVWTADGGATADPIELPVTLTVTAGTAGEQLDIAAYQECEDGSSYRWTQGSEGTPPVRLELTEGETGTVDHGDGGHGTEAEAGDTETETETPEHATPTSPAPTADEPDTEAAAEDDDSGSMTASVVAVMVVLLGAGAGAAVRRSRKDDR